MKAAFLKGPNVVSIDDVPIPKIGPREILVEMKACGICGTDIEKMHGTFITPPRLGHEVTGEVIDVGAEVNEVKREDRVFVHHHVPCYKCHYCRHSDYTMCAEFSTTNLDPCGLSEYFRVPEPNLARGAVLPLPDNVSFEEGTLIEPTACCLRGLNKTQLAAGDDVLIMGAGPAGLTMIGLLRLRGTHAIAVSEITDFRIKAAEDFGADVVINPQRRDLRSEVLDLTHGIGMDLVIVAVGSVQAISQGIECVRKGGQILLFGIPPKGDALSYDASKIFINEVSLIPSYSTTEIETSAALKIIEKKRLKIKKLITHIFPLNETAKAMKQAAKGEKALKTVITP